MYVVHETLIRSLTLAVYGPLEPGEVAEDGAAANMPVWGAAATLPLSLVLGWLLTRLGWLTTPSALPEDGAPSASLDRLKAQAASTHPGAPPEQLESLRWPQQLASGRPKVEDAPPPGVTTRSR